MRKETNKRGKNPRPYRIQRIVEPSMVLDKESKKLIPNPRKRKVAIIRHYESDFE